MELGYLPKKKASPESKALSGTEYYSTGYLSDVCKEVGHRLSGEVAHSMANLYYIETMDTTFYCQTLGYSESLLVHSEKSTANQDQCSSRIICT